MKHWLVVLVLAVAAPALAQGPYRSEIRYDSYEGLVMAGYQGWFNTPGDGAGRNWHHYEKGRRFEPGWCTIDLWPEVSEYPDLYETAFTFGDGTYASVPSAYDYSTVDVHFRWMQEYGLDGVFLQRFVAEIANPSGRAHFDKVVASAMECANRYSRAVAIMYDLSGMPAKGPDILLKDIDRLAKAHHLFDHAANPSYLYQNGKPLVAVWGVGFNDNRRYGFDECEKIIDGLRKKGYSVLIGVPTRWRTLTGDTLPDARLHDLIRKCDVVMPWFVGRYNERTYPEYHQLIREDMAWAGKEGIAYAPLCFPGFSWANMQRPGRPGVQIPRNGGRFFKQQLDYCLDSGAKMLYIAMFDEIDEGTAIFKQMHVSDVPSNVPYNKNNVPSGYGYSTDDDYWVTYTTSGGYRMNSKEQTGTSVVWSRLASDLDIRFQGIDDDKGTDWYLKLTGAGAKMLRGEIKMSSSIPSSL